MAFSEPLVVVEHLAKAYGIGEVQVHALRDASLQISAGEFVVLLGPSGSGKTTLLNMIGGLDSPTGGRVRVRGVNIAEYNENQLTAYRRQTVGFIFQFFNLIPTLTALENVELVAELVGRREQALARLEQVGLGNRAHHFPSELSGGEQQRVAIARALAKEPDVILADEPTGNLDYETSLVVLRALRDVNILQNKAVMVVTHNNAIAQMADTIVRMRSGVVVEQRRNAQPLQPEALQW